MPSQALLWRVEALERKASDQDRERVGHDPAHVARSLVDAWSAAERGEGDPYWRRGMLALRDALTSGVVVVAGADQDQDEHDDFVDQVWTRHLERVGLG